MTRVTTQQRTNAFYIQSPRLQNAVPVKPPENLVLRAFSALPQVTARVDSDIR